MLQRSGTEYEGLFAMLDELLAEGQTVKLHFCVIDTLPGDFVWLFDAQYSRMILIKDRKQFDAAMKRWNEFREFKRFKEDGGVSQ